MRFATGFRFAAAIALFFGLAVTGANRAGAEHVPITIHAMECYTGVGAAIFEECHTEVDSGAYITDDSGGTAILSIPGDILDWYLGAYIYCRDLVDDEVLFDGNYADTGGGAVIAVEEGDEIVCDVYLITPAPKAEPEKPAHDGGYTGGTTTVTTLPSTGAGAASADSSQGMLLIIGLLGVAATAFGLSVRRSPR